MIPLLGNVKVLHTVDVEETGITLIQRENVSSNVKVRLNMKNSMQIIFIIFLDKRTMFLYSWIINFSVSTTTTPPETSSAAPGINANLMLLHNF